jgi:desulfoferrodoxin (superoxide reductase-like protein)
MFGNIPFDEIDAHRLIHFIAEAGDLALPHTNTPAHHGEWIAFANKLERFFVIAECGEAHITLNVDAGGTGTLAGTDAIRIVIR